MPAQLTLKGLDLIMQNACFIFQLTIVDAALKLALNLVSRCIFSRKCFHVHLRDLRKIFLLNISSNNNTFRGALILHFQLHMLFCGIPVAFCGIFLTSGRCFMLIDTCISLTI